MPIELPLGSAESWAAEIDLDLLATWVAEIEAAPEDDKGEVLECCVAWLISHISGMKVMFKNTFSFGRASEIDLTVWNEQHEAGFKSFSDVILVECKNWAKAVGAAEVAWFDWKLQLGGATHGLLVTANGITGKADERQFAYQIIQQARTSGRTIAVLALKEIAALDSKEALRDLIITKVCKVTAAAIQTAHE